MMWPAQPNVWIRHCRWMYSYLHIIMLLHSVEGNHGWWVGNNNGIAVPCSVNTSVLDLCRDQKSYCLQIQASIMFCEQQLLCSFIIIIIRSLNAHRSPMSHLFLTR